MSKEADEAGCQQVFDATVEGVLTILRPLCLKYRPRLRERFLDFDRRRSGVCEASKLGAALGVIQADLNKDQMRALTQGFAARGPAFQGCFDWRRFVEALETVCGCRLWGSIFESIWVRFYISKCTRRAFWWKMLIERAWNLPSFIVHNSNLKENEIKITL